MHSVQAIDPFDPGYDYDTCPHCQQAAADYRAARQAGHITDYDDVPF